VLKAMLNSNQPTNQPKIFREIQPVILLC